MSTREFFVTRFNVERPVTIKVLRALPQDHLDYKPHERNNSAGDIAWFLALEQGYFAEMFESGAIHRDQVPSPGSLDAIHHRGQLSVYLRPMGGKVPAIYGPSADERP